MLITPVSATTRPFIGSGVECYVYEWADTEGVPRVLKTFKQEYEARVAYDRQLEASMHPDLAPSVDEGFGVQQVYVPGRQNNGYESTRWGYLSESVDTDHGCYINGWDESGDEEYEELIERLEGYGISTCDLHGNNVGRNTNGMLVRIDFGDEST